MFFKKLLYKERKLSLIVILAIISFLSFNVLNKNFFKNIRFDLTKDEVYTLSEGTKSVLKSINEPLDFKLFYTKQIGDANPVYQNYYSRVKELLEQYVILSNNKIKFKIALACYFFTSCRTIIFINWLIPIFIQINF